MGWVTTQEIEKTRQIDLLTYLKLYDPSELVRIGNGIYSTRTHDSLKISNGAWMWFSRGIGGYSALDYLIKVKEIPFVARKDAYLGTFSLSYPTKIALPYSLDSYKRSFSMQYFMISRSIPLLQRYATTLLLLSFLSGSSSFLS